MEEPTQVAELTSEYPDESAETPLYPTKDRVVLIRCIGESVVLDPMIVDVQRGAMITFVLLDGEEAHVKTQGKESILNPHALLLNPECRQSSGTFEVVNAPKNHSEACEIKVTCGTDRVMRLIGPRMYVK